MANAQNEPSEPSTALKKKVPTPLGAKQTEQAETVQLKPTESAPKTGDTLSNPPKLKPGKAESIEQAPDDQSKKLRVTEAQKPSRAGTIEEPKKLLKPVQVGTSCLSIVPFIQTFSINISFFFSLFLISSLVYHLVRNDQCWIHHIELEFPSSNWLKFKIKYWSWFRVPNNLNPMGFSHIVIFKRSNSQVAIRWWQQHSIHFSKNSTRVSCLLRPVLFSAFRYFQKPNWQCRIILIASRSVTASFQIRTMTVTIKFFVSPPRHPSPPLPKNLTQRNC